MIYLPKSKDSPPCLEEEKKKLSGTYNCNGVAEALKNDFHNKCYICENKEPHSINIEHFKPHKNINPQLKFDWNNLFFCCAHCNNIKGARPEFDDILNCTIETEMIEKEIRYFIETIPFAVPEITAIHNTERVNNTVKLLNEVYNGETEQKRLESDNIRSKLLTEIRTFQDLLFKCFNDEFNEQDRNELIKSVIRRLRDSSAFTAFKRWIIRDKPNLKKKLEFFIRDNEDLKKEFLNYI